MTKLMTTLTISAIASILIIGGFVASPNAYSSLNSIDDDDCDNDNDSSNHDDYGSHHDDCENDHPDDPCDCEKPDTLKFIVSTPTSQMNNEFKIEIFKNLSDIDNPDKILTDFIDVTNGENFVLQSSSFGKDKLNSNTVFVIYNVTSGVNVQVASMEIHTSCSKPLYKGLTVSNAGYSIGVTDGLKKDTTSIPEFAPLICEDETKPQQMGSIVIRKTITNDNGGNANATDFTVKLTNVETGIDYILVHDQDESIDPSVNVNQVPTGTYKISETTADTVTGTYTTVLIAGDTKCPVMVDESFTINKGSQISCIIYNDDNGDGSGGIVFQNESLQVQLDANVLNDSCDQYTIEEKNVTPCIEIINRNSGDIAIVDSALISATTIVLFSVAQEGQLDSDTGALNPNCEQFTIIKHDKQVFTLQDDDLSFPTIPTKHLVVVLQCANMDPTKVYNVNYVMIDPTM